MINNFFVRLCLAATLLAPISASAQVTIGGANTPQSFSVLELKSNNESGLRLPQMSTAYRNAMQATFGANGADESLAVGLMIYNTDNNCIETWNGREWISLCAAPSCSSNGIPQLMRIGANLYFTYTFMTNGVCRRWMVENLRAGVPTNIFGPGTTDDIWNQYLDYPFPAVGERGYYYGWGAAQIACPPGWSLPTPEEFGRNENEGLWQTLATMPNNNGADNPRRFWREPTALAGNRSPYGPWYTWGSWGGWWSRGMDGVDGQHFHGISDGNMGFLMRNVARGFSARCIQVE